MILAPQLTPTIKKQCRHRIASNILFVAILLLGLSAAHASTTRSTPQNTKTNDIRVLIDISGSMKKNDPTNLRQPALNLFISLLPNETHTGVWTFGQWVNMLIPHGQATKRWKINAKASVKMINSVGLYTNLEDVIQDSTWDWINTTPSQGSERSLILLTDGLVDISKNEKDNQASRNRILQKTLPLLQKAGVTIHSIALSTDSDKNLLEQLSTATNGRFETIKTAEGLERLFLHLFENVAPTDTLPIADNKVKVDDSIKEMTFLIFRKNKGENSSITSPSGQKYDITSTKEKISWHTESHYDLVTIQEPETGYWKINAEVDPDNRVMVITNLKLINSKLPSSLYLGDKQSFHIHLEDDGTIIDKRDFLHFIKVTLNQVMIDENNNEKTWKLKLRDNGRGADKTKKDGVYSVALKKSLLAGEHEIDVAINGTTFRRHFRKQFIVYSNPATANVEQIKKDTFKVSILPYQALIDTNSMAVTLTHKLPNGEIKKSQVPQLNPAEWSKEYSTEGISGKHEVIIKITGTRREGSPIDATLPPLTIEFEDSKPTSTSHNKNPEKEGDEVDDSAELGYSWSMVLLKVGAFNAFIIGLCFLVYKYLPQIRRKFIPNISEELADV